MRTRNSVFFLLLLFLFVEGLHAEGYLEFRPTLFYPASHRTRKLFNNGGLYENQIEGGYWSYPDWTVWGNVSYFKRRGEIRSSQEHFDANVVTLSGGASYHFPLYLKCPGWNGYLGGGPLVGRLKKCNKLRSALGGVVKLGMFYKFHPWGHLNVFCDYNQLVFPFEKVDSSPRSNLTWSGFRLGIGLAAEF